MKNSLLYPVNSRSRRAVSLDGMWRMQFDPASEGRALGFENRLPAPFSVPVPSSFNDLFTDKASRDYTGDFWYETDFFVPGEWKGKEIVIRFGSATHRACVFVNGREITSHTGGFLPFNAVVTDAVDFNADNHLSVLMNNELSETMIPCGKTETKGDGTKISGPYFDFFNYAGIQRPVKLMALPSEQITDYSFVTRSLTDREASVDVTVTTTGNHAVTATLYDAEGRECARGEGKSCTLQVADPIPWALRNAYLYTIVLTIKDGGEIVDEYREKVGIRTFVIEDGHFLLNGSPVYMKGYGRHEDADIRGKGLDLPILKRDFELMKWTGANCFRTSHYPYAEEVYQMADEEGFLVIDEVPAVGMFESLMNAVDAAGGSRAQVHWFEKETTLELLAHHRDCIRDMILRDKNHPSVIAWSLLNEPETIYDCAVPYFENVFAYAHEIDPEKRPRTFALVANSTPGRCKCWQVSDFVSLNRYYGWYFLNGFRLSDAEAAFRGELTGWAEIHGDKPVVFTEYGADTNGELHKLPSVMWAQEYQDEYLSMCARVFDSFPFVQGEMVWNFADFQTTEGIIRMNGNKKGVFTRDRQPKDAAYLLRKRWLALPDEK